MVLDPARGIPRRGGKKGMSPRAIPRVFRLICFVLGGGRNYAPELAPLGKMTEGRRARKEGRNVLVFDVIPNPPRFNLHRIRVPRLRVMVPRVSGFVPTAPEVRADGTYPIRVTIRLSRRCWYDVGGIMFYRHSRTPHTPCFLRIIRNPTNRTRRIPAPRPS